MPQDKKQVDILLRVRDALKRAQAYQDKWRKEAEESANFVSGHQWSDSDLSRMKETQKPAITYNRIAPMLNSILGTEIQHRQKMIFIPRHPDKDVESGVSDMATDAYLWALRMCNGEYERSSVFRDMLITGIGWAHFYMDYNDDLDGKLVLERIPVEQVYFDEDARKQNLSDANWVARQKKMTQAEIESLWPDKIDEVKSDHAVHSSLNPTAESEEVSIPTTIVNHGPDHYKEGVQEVRAGSTANPINQQGDRKMMLVTEYQWREKEEVYRFLEDETAQQAAADLDLELAPMMLPNDPEQTGSMPAMPPAAPAVPQVPGMPPQAQQAMQKAAQNVVQGQQEQAAAAPTPAPPPPAEPVVSDEPQFVTVSPKEWKKLVARLEEIGQEVPQHVRQHRWRYRRVFCTGGVVLQEDELPSKSFSYQAMTAMWDNKEKVFYGLVRSMKDPQRGANKYFSLGVHLFSISPKGTMLAETGAFVNPKKIASDWAKPGAVIGLKPGALANNMLKVEPSPPFPEAATTMIKFSLESLRDVTGINLEMMGQSEGSEPGTAIAKRQTQAMTILAPIFASYSRYRETEAYLVLDYLKAFMTDGRWIRLGGPYNSQYARLLIESFAEDYDLMLDDSPTDPNQKMAVWENLQPLLPMLVRQGTFPLALLDYAPLPTSVVSSIKREIENKAKSGQQGPQQLPPKKEQNPEYMQATVEKLKAEAALDKARAQALLQESNIKMTTEVQEVSANEQPPMPPQGGPNAKT